ncbi:holin [Mycobacterium phage Skinny]|uniref:Holin n=6 Tax=Bongovirus bongo TaxID=1983750 RepID=A0A0M3UKK3_9CAUD|nr:holin [Mycobacterium phage PegLeg]YP_009604895.1 holin [Mycobacterium phage Bongo]ALF00565.1 holin [Mycobacterium phage Bricole]AXQ52678.1 holin [Mycobacterium phage IPhane7]QDH93610.1 holin [Mycobacterium phage LilhomieP]QGJ93184.1 holin [Mycobacterium phage TyDawg]UXE05244.1 holin [Mycobacterium phage Skinny]
MKVREVKKAIAAGATALAGMEGLAAALEASATHPWVHAVAVGFSLLVTGATWLVRNKATVDQVLDAFESDPVVAEAVIERATDDPYAVEKAVEKHPTLAEVLIASYED